MAHVGIEMKDAFTITKNVLGNMDVQMILFLQRKNVIMFWKLCQEYDVPLSVPTSHTSRCDLP